MLCLGVRVCTVLQHSVHQHATTYVEEYTLKPVSTYLYINMQVQRENIYIYMYIRIVTQCSGHTHYTLSAQMHMCTHPPIQACPYHMYSHTRHLQLTLCWQGGLHLRHKFLHLCITACCTGNFAVCPQSVQCCILLQVLKQEISCIILICSLNPLF